MASGLGKLELVLEAIDRATGPLRAVERAIGSVERASSRSTGVMSRLGEAGAGAMRALGTAAKYGALAGITAVAAGLAVGLKEAIEFESAMADIAKVADFSSPAGLASMSDAILKMSQTIPVAATGLAKITAEAIQAGISTQDALDFTDLVAKSSVAFDMTADAAGEAFAKIRNIFKLDQDGLREVADATNYLSNVMASKAPEIVNFLKRAGGAAPLLKMSAVEMSALGSTMISLGVVPETAAEGVTKLFTALKTGDKKTEKALKVLGFTRKEFLKLAETDPGAAFEKFFKAIDQNGEKGLGALKDIVGQDFTDDFLKLASNSKMVGDAFRYVADHAKYAGSVLKEYDARAATTANNWQLFKNNLAVLRIESISRALPAINGFLDRMNKIMMTLDQRTTLFERIGAAWSGFVNGLGVQALEGAAQAVSDLGAALEKFLFGTVDERERDPLARVFASAHDAGAILRRAFDGVRSAATSAWTAIETAWGKATVFFNQVWAGLVPHGDQIEAGFVALGATVAGHVDKIGGILKNLGTVASEVFTGLAGTDFGVNLGDFGGAAIERALGLYGRFQGMVGSLLDQLREFTGWLATSAGKIDWGSLIPKDVPGIGALEGLAHALGGMLDELEGLGRLAGNTLVSYFQGYFAGFEPYIEPLVTRLQSIWNRLGPILKNLGDIGSNIGRMYTAIGANSTAMGAVQKFGEVMGTLGGMVANVSLAGLDTALAFIEKLTSVVASLTAGDWGGARATIEQFFSWLGALKLPVVTIDVEQLRAAFDTVVGVVQAAWERLKSIFDTIANASWLGALKLPVITIDVAQLRAAFDTVVGVVQAAWERLKSIFDTIANAARGVADAIASVISTDGADGITQLMAAASGDGLAEGWSGGLDAIERYFNKVTDLAQLGKELTAAQAAIPAGDTAALERARQTLEVYDRIAQAQQSTGPAMPSVDNVLAAQGDVDRLNAAIGAASDAGRALPSAIADALSAADATVKAFDLAADGARIMASFNAGLSTGGMQAAATMRATVASIRAAASLDLTQQGMNIMNTLAAGMRARAGAVVAEIKAVTQALRDHLPNSPAKTGPLSDIHRLRFMETVAKSVRPDPLVNAMRGAAAAGMDALGPLQGQIGLRAGAHAPVIGGEARSRAVVAASAARRAETAGGGNITLNIHTPIEGPVNFAKPEDRQEFEALLDRHAKKVAQVVENEARRRSRTSFRGEAA